MAYNPMSHVGLEDDFATPEQLTKMSRSWHYGWTWKGTKPCVDCEIAPCGFISLRNNDCPEHGNKREGSAKQLHKASDCPANAV